MSPRTLFWLGLFFWGVMEGGGLAGPLTFNSALPLPQGQSVFREVVQWQVKRSAGAEVSALATVSVLALSLTEKNALFVVAPYLEKRLKSKGKARSVGGLGDITLFDRATISVKNEPGKTVRTALFGGLQAPTGSFGKSDRLGLLPRPLQPGSGAWAGILGATYTDQAFSREVDASLQFVLPGTRAGYHFGESFRLDGSWQVRFLPRELGEGVPSFLYGVLELSAEGKLRDRKVGQEVSTTGGFTLQLTPGLQWVTPRYVLEGGITFPVLTEVSKGGLKDRVRFLFSVRHNF